MDVANWLRALGLERYEATFRENDVDAELLPNLAADDLKELGITSLGHRRRLLEAIAALRPKDTPAGDPVRLSTSPTGSLVMLETTAERRPLSVMFCDLIGSTALSPRLDPEDLREVIRTYQAYVATTIQQFDGFIARDVGDGVLIYFGWPEARETDAERAVQAGLGVAAPVSAAPVSGAPLQVRIGIATGLVVIGEPIGLGDAQEWSNRVGLRWQWLKRGRISVRLRSVYALLMVNASSIRERFVAVGRGLNERTRRLFAAAEAQTAGYGGGAATSRATGVARSTIGRGLKELCDPASLTGKVRRPGSGRPALTEKDTGQNAANPVVVAFHKCACHGIVGYRGPG
jgi:class 3 adenylate cyclase